MNDWTLPKINQQKCTNCGSCTSVCPEHALSMVDGEIVFVKPEACTYCAQCEVVCPVGAITCGFTVSWTTND